MTGPPPGKHKPDREHCEREDLVLIVEDLQTGPTATLATTFLVTLTRRKLSLSQAFIR